MLKLISFRNKWWRNWRQNTSQFDTLLVLAIINVSQNMNYSCLKSFFQNITHSNFSIYCIFTTIINSQFVAEPQLNYFHLYIKMFLIWVHRVYVWITDKTVNSYKSLSDDFFCRVIYKQVECVFKNFNEKYGYRKQMLVYVCLFLFFYF